MIDTTHDDTRPKRRGRPPKATQRPETERADADLDFTLSINGTVTMIGHPSVSRQGEATLRGIALSNSPVQIAGGLEEDRRVLAEQLHQLSRRAAHPLHFCSGVNDARRLLDALLDAAAEGRDHDGPVVAESERGTWALSEICDWPLGAQEQLERALAYLDGSWLGGRTKNEDMPRVVVLSSDDAGRR